MGIHSIFFAVSAANGLLRQPILTRKQLAMASFDAKSLEAGGQAV
jgi:hypothetical protein